MTEDTRSKNFVIFDSAGEGKLRSGIALQGKCFTYSLAALVFDVDAAFHGLGSFLELRGDLTDVPGMGNGISLVGDNGNGEAHDWKLFLIASTVHGVDVALEAILSIVEVWNDEVKSLDDGLANRVDGSRSTQEDKVVASDMADKSFRGC